MSSGLTSNIPRASAGYHPNRSDAGRRVTLKALETYAGAAPAELRGAAIFAGAAGKASAQVNAVILGADRLQLDPGFVGPASECTSPPPRRGRRRNGANAFVRRRGRCEGPLASRAA